jgi:hypothetical protein
VDDPDPAAVRVDRHLDWPESFNIRDLGGLPTVDGRETRRRAVLRGDTVGRLTSDGWAALWDYGVRTVINLRDGDEAGNDASPRPAELHTVHVPLDDRDDREFWEHVHAHQLDGSPLELPESSQGDGDRPDGTDIQRLLPFERVRA